MNNIVSLVKCNSYDAAETQAAVKSVIDLLGGIDKFVKPGQVVVLKPNLIAGKAPEKAATTHPAVVEAVAKLVLAAGAKKCIIADSAGAPYSKSFMNPMMKAAGFTAAAQSAGASVNDDYGIYRADLPDAAVGKTFSVLNVLQEADVIINLAKLKTHFFAGYSACVKNMFGAIPGLEKVEMHGRFQNLANFNNFLYDVQDYFKDKIVLHLIDAVVGMEGPGPTAGTPRQVGALLASENPLACDIAGLKIIKMKHIDRNPTVKIGFERGYIDKNIDVEVVGDKIGDFNITNYKFTEINESTTLIGKGPKWVLAILNYFVTQRPVVSRKKCKGCKKCEEHCPVKAIDMTKYKKGKKPDKVKFKYDKCIRCYCCQELCPYGLVKVKNGPFYRIMKGRRNRLEKNGPNKARE